MEKQNWREKRFLNHEIVENVNEAEYIRIPGMSIFNGDRLSLWLQKVIESPPPDQVINLSLLLNKFPYWFIDKDGKYSLDHGFSRIRENNRLSRAPHDYGKELLMAVARLSKAMPAEYDELLKRHYSSLDGHALCYTDLASITRLLIGHSGSASVLEVGINLHPYYGFPVIPGSAIKGVTRHFCQDTERLNDAELEEIFGNEPQSGVATEGAVVFYDAWPIVRKPGRSLLEVDNITTHYPRYYREYQKPETSEADSPNPTQRTPFKKNVAVFPADDDNPIPVFFLAVARGVTFRFAVRPSVGTDKSELAGVALNLTREAMMAFGIGAKTGSSYGYFRPEE